MFGPLRLRICFFSRENKMILGRNKVICFLQSQRIESLKLVENKQPPLPYLRKAKNFGLCMHLTFGEKICTS